MSKEYVFELQKIFIDFFDKGDPMNGGINYRFPVVTVNFSKHRNEETGKDELDKEDAASSQIILIPDVDSLKKIMESLGLADI